MSRKLCITLLFMPLATAQPFGPWQKDSLAYSSNQKKVKLELSLKTSQVFFRIYHNIVSSQDGSVCHFKPTCSSYTRQAIKKYGFLKGILIAGERLIRDHLFSTYAIDHLK